MRAKNARFIQGYSVLYSYAWEIDIDWRVLLLDLDLGGVAV
jgi:hypothetical protein